MAQLLDDLQHSICVGSLHFRQIVGCHLPTQVQTVETQSQIPNYDQRIRFVLCSTQCITLEPRPATLQDIEMKWFSCNIKTIAQNLTKSCRFD